MKTSIATKLMTTHAAKRSRSAAGRLPDELKLEVDELGRFIAHTHKGDRQQCCHLKSTHGYRKTLIVTCIAVPILNQLDQPQYAQPNQRRKSWKAGAIVEVAEIRDENRCELNNLRQRMRTEDKPAVANKDE